jgi:outer membrane protein TolC
MCIAGMKRVPTRLRDFRLGTMPAAADRMSGRSASSRGDVHVLRQPIAAGSFLIACLALFPLGIFAQQSASVQPSSSSLPQAPEPTLQAPAPMQPPASGQPSDPAEPLNLDMASVADVAHSRSWVSKQAHQDALTAAADARRVASSRWGQVNFQSQYLRFNQPLVIESPIPSNLQPVFGMKSLTTPFAPQDSLHVNFQAGFPIFTGGKIDNAIKATRDVSHATAEAASDTDDDVVLQAEQNYLSVLLARQVVDLNVAALKSYNEHLDHAKTSFKLGTVANYDVIRAEAAVAEQDKRLTEAKNQLDLAEAALRTSLALEDSTPIEIGGSLFEITDPVDLNASMDAAVNASPLLQALRDKVAADHHGVRVQEADYLPQVTAISGKEMVTSKLSQIDSTWVAGAHASLELWDGGERRARVSEARSQLQSAEFELNHAEEQVRLAVRSAYLDLQSQQSELASAQKAAERNAEALRLANKRFDVGTGTSLEVLDANVSLTVSQIGVQQALWGEDLAYLRIHRYLGDIAEISTRIQK